MCQLWHTSSINRNCATEAIQQNLDDRSYSAESGRQKPFNGIWTTDVIQQNMGDIRYSREAV